MLLHLLLFSVTVGQINCVEVEMGRVTQSGWTTDYELAVPLKVGGINYFFSIRRNNWVIQRLYAGGTMGQETSNGTFRNHYRKAFAFNIDGRQFIQAVDADRYFIIQEILPGGVMGEERDRGYWDLLPNLIFPLNIQGNQYVFTHVDHLWSIKRLLSDGSLLRENVDQGSWQNVYKVGFPFSMDARQFIYCVSGNNWFIREISANGKMLEETDSGHWDERHILSVPFSLNGYQFFYSVTKEGRDWILQELLLGGKMGQEKARGSWNYYYRVVFTYSGWNQYLYGLSGNGWVIRQVKVKFPNSAVLNPKLERSLIIKHLMNLLGWPFSVGSFMSPFLSD